MTTDRADVLGGRAEAGEVRINLGDARTGAGFSVDASVWGPWGYIARPAPPNDDGCARGWYQITGNQHRVFGMYDVRFAARVGELKDGDIAIVTLGNARLLFKAADDCVSVYTVSAPDDKDMHVTLNGKAGTLTLQVAGAFIEVTNDRISMAVSGGGTLMLDATGLHVSGTTFDANTAGGRLGKLVCSAPTPNPAHGIDAVAGPAAVPSVTWFRDP